MVRRTLIAALALAWGGAAQAQAVDWRRAGGELFAQVPLAFLPPGASADYVVSGGGGEKALASSGAN